MGKGNLDKCRNLSTGMCRRGPPGPQGDPGIPLPWSTITTNTQMVPNHGYLINTTSQPTLTLPSACELGDIIQMSSNVLGSWRIQGYPGQVISVPPEWIERTSSGTASAAHLMER